jgi:hypothetical protein
MPVGAILDTHHRTVRGGALQQATTPFTELLRAVQTTEPTIALRGTVAATAGDQQNRLA